MRTASRVVALQGFGIEQLSMAQLDVLEELHHAALSATAARRLDLVGWPHGTAGRLMLYVCACKC